MHYYFSQAVYGSDGYGSSLYSAEETSTQTQQPSGLVETGSPVFWGGVLGLSIVIASLFTYVQGRRRKNGKK